GTGRACEPFAPHRSGARKALHRLVDQLLDRPLGRGLVLSRRDKTHRMRLSKIASGAPPRVSSAALIKKVATDRPLRVGLISLGCAKNLVDAEIMLGSMMK